MVEGKRTAARVRAHAQTQAAAIAGAALLSIVGSRRVRLRRDCPTAYQRRRGRRDRSRCARGAGSAGPAGAAAPASNLAIGPVQFSPRAGFATEYMSRGTTQSAHQPAAGAVIEATLADKLYASAGVTTVRLPGNATAEVALSYGIRPSFSSVDFDISWNYYAYPGQGAATANGGSQYGCETSTKNF